MKAMRLMANRMAKGKCFTKMVTTTKVISSSIRELAKESSPLPVEIYITVSGKKINAMAKQKSTTQMERSMKAIS